MRRPTTTRLAVAVLALAMLGAPCTTTGPGPRDFAAGALVIPMDNCYQKRDASAAAGGQTQSCNAGRDDGVFRAYGLVYFLLQKGVTVYWAIDGATPKNTVTAVDVVVPAPASGAVARKLDWASGAFADFGYPATTAISYPGGPFVVDPADKARALDLLLHDADIAKVKNRTDVEVHEVAMPFHANQVRPLSGTPPRLAILGINPKPYHKTSFDVMYRYAVAAGFDWPCTPASGDCAGGLGQGCDPTVVQRYLADTLCASGAGGNASCADTANECHDGCDPNWVSPNITGAQFNPPGVPGKVYDVLCDGDFTGAYADSTLGRGGYKLLWAPHWDTAGFDPASATGAGATLGQQLRNIAAFVRAGNNLFAECAAIGALETGNINGGTLLRGVAETQFQSTAGMKSTSNANQTSTQPFLAPQHPNLQIGDFSFPASGSNVSGAITMYFPDRAGTPTSAYRPGAERLITVLSTTPPWDVSSTLQVTTSDGVKVGTVAYLGGHDYSPQVGNTPGSGGQTAGTRIVLNTLFNLGFACADPNTTCQVEGVPSNSACALGVLKCSGSGGFTCVPNVRPGELAEVCGNGVDDNCDGQVDEGCAGTCTPAATRQCDGGAPAAQICVRGTQTCSAQGIWGACEGLRLKSPEACNGVDDDCNGQTDEGTICPFGQTCTGGVCLPRPCDLEVRCPAGFTCTGTSPNSQCTPVSCGAGGACPAGKVCSAGSCVDPCAQVHCGPGSTCSGGVCFGGACYTSGCPQGQLCQAGQCLADPCAGLTCPQGTFCRAGTCVRSCTGVTCAPGQHCGVDGFCEAGEPCAATCQSGTTCQNGQCQPDPACAGVGCGQGQVCHGGSCVDDPCNGVTCPTGTCQAGQCQGGTASTATVPKEAGEKSGGCGCGSAGGLDLLGLALGLALWPRLRRRATPRPARPAPAPVLALAVGIGLLASGCGKSTSERCPSASTPCGTLCCASGYACQSGSCVFGTQNPVITAVSPSRAGIGTTVNLALTGEGFQSGAVARVTGPGLSADWPLDVASATSATLPGLDLSQASPGTAEIRVVNPTGHLASNAATLALTSDPVPVGVSPTSVRQDAAAPAEVRVSGSAFGAGMIVTLSKGGASRDFTPTAVAAQEATVQVDPATLAIGVYDVTVRFPSGTASPAVKLAVVEGLPHTTGLAPACQAPGSSFVGAITGTFLYPSSTVHVSGPGVADSPLITRCAQATPAQSGQCEGGQLEAVVDLTAATSGNYQVWVVNPGAPALASTPALTFKVGTCP